jgi:hypothetical protein
VHRNHRTPQCLHDHGRLAPFRVPSLSSQTADPTRHWHATPRHTDTRMRGTDGLLNVRTGRTRYTSRARPCARDATHTRTVLSGLVPSGLSQFTLQTRDDHTSSGSGFRVTGSAPREPRRIRHMSCVYRIPPGPAYARFDFVNPAKIYNISRITREGAPRPRQSAEGEAPISARERDRRLYMARSGPQSSLPSSPHTHTADSISHD